MATMTYQLTETGYIKRELENGTTLVLPAENNGTPEWRAYQTWLDAGNTPEPVPPAPPPPPPGPTIEELVAEIDALKAQLSITTARVDA